MSFDIAIQTQEKPEFIPSFKDISPERKLSS